jgi:hypothetical protein
MARQEGSCWRCGDRWVTTDAVTVTPKQDDVGAQAARWIDEGGSWADRPLVGARL